MESARLPLAVQFRAIVEKGLGGPDGGEDRMHWGACFGVGGEGRTTFGGTALVVVVMEGSGG